MTIEDLRAQLHTYVDACIDAFLNPTPPTEEQPPLESQLVVTVTERQVLSDKPILSEAANPAGWSAALKFIIKDCGSLAAIRKKYSLSEADRKHLSRLENRADQLQSGFMDLQTILAEELTPAEAALFQSK